jgi:hypothetical protein
MPVSPRIEDVIVAWRQYIWKIIDELHERGEFLAQEQFTAAEGKISLSAEGKEIDVWLIEKCFLWLTEKGYWHKKDCDRVMVITEVRSGLSRLRRELFPEAESSEIDRHSWALSIAICSALGALLLSPLGAVLMDARTPGVFFGAVAGAYIATRGLEQLGHHRKVGELLRTAFGVAGSGLAASGMWRALRGRLGGGARAFVEAALVWLLALLLKPGPVIAASGQVFGKRFVDDLRWKADLALALLWASPERQVRVEEREPELPVPVLAGPICAALSDLRKDLDSIEPASELRDSLEALFQRFEEDGYEWKFVPAGTEFEPEMENIFKTFGNIRPGEPVKTRQAAILRRNKLIDRGELRRLSN